jgi:hypothetical protein
LLGLALLLIGWVGVLFGRLIQAAVSRQRESLADASSVQFTRNPAGLASALKKIGGLSYGSRIEAPHAEEASHMFFGNGKAESWLSLLDTHPPLVERIRALDPSFDGTFPPISERGVEAETEEPPVSSSLRRPPFGFPFPAMPSASDAAAGLIGAPLLAAHSVTANTGTPTTAHLRYAVDVRGLISANLQQEARDPLGASCLVYALLLSDDQGVRAKQLDELARATSATVVQETLRILPEVNAVATRAKLPLVDLALPGLRHLSPSQFQQFRTAVQALVEADGEIDLFEYVLQKIVVRHLEPHFLQARKPVVQFYALRPLAGDCAALLSALAYIGQTAPDAIQAAFRQGAQLLAAVARVELALVKEADCDLPQVDAALERLAQAVPQIKKNVLNACALTVAADGVVLELEAELLRAIADTLDCPLPPFIAQATQTETPAE